MSEELIMKVFKLSRVIQLKGEPSLVLPFYSTSTDTASSISPALGAYWKSQGVDGRIFSNLYSANISLPYMRLNGNTVETDLSREEKFASTEHYFQSAKYSEEDRNFMALLSPGDCARYGQKRLVFNERYIKRFNTLAVPPTLSGQPYAVGDRSSPQIIVPRWDHLKIEVMFDALKAKFSQNPSLHQQLINTGEAWLIEHTTNDGQWGDGGDGSGTNFLGKLLFLLREELLHNENYFDQLKDTAEFSSFLSTPNSKFVSYS